MARPTKWSSTPAKYTSGKISSQTAKYRKRLPSTTATTPTARTVRKAQVATARTNRTPARSRRVAPALLRRPAPHPRNRKSVHGSPARHCYYSCCLSSRRMRPSASQNTRASNTNSTVAVMLQPARSGDHLGDTKSNSYRPFCTAWALAPCAVT